METERGFSSYADTQSEPPGLECARGLPFLRRLRAELAAADDPLVLEDFNQCAESATLCVHLLLQPDEQHAQFRDGVAVRGHRGHRAGRQLAVAVALPRARDRSQRVAPPFR